MNNFIIKKLRLRNNGSNIKIMQNLTIRERVRQNRAALLKQTPKSAESEICEISSPTLENVSNNENFDDIVVETQDEIKNVTPLIENVCLDEFKSYIKDKTIALVANSSSLINFKLGNYIDQHDIVVRFNAFKLIDVYTGVKTNIHVNTFLNIINYDIPVDFRLVFAGNDKIQKKVILNNSVYTKTIFEITHPFTSPLIKSFNYYPSGLVPTTGFSLLRFLMDIGGYKYINLFGFTFYKNGNNDIFRSENADNFISTRHDYAYEKKWIEENCSLLDSDDKLLIHRINKSLNHENQITLLSEIENKNISIDYNKKICLVTVCDDNFIVGAEKLLISFLNKNYWFNGDIVVLCHNIISPLCGYNRNKLKDIYPNIIIKEIEDEKHLLVYDKFKKIKGMHLRMLPSLLKIEIFSFKEYDSVLFLDADMLVINDIKELFFVDIDLAFTPDTKNYPTNLFVKSTDMEETPINGGFLLMGKKWLNKDIKNVLLDLAYSMERLPLYDQTVFNEYFKTEEFLVLNSDYNLLKRTFPDNKIDIFNENRKSIKIIHYVGRKPWQNKDGLNINSDEFNYKFLEKEWFN